MTTIASSSPSASRIPVTAGRSGDGTCAGQYRRTVRQNSPVRWNRPLVDSVVPINDGLANELTLTEATAAVDHDEIPVSTHSSLELIEFDVRSTRRSMSVASPNLMNFRFRHGQTVDFLYRSHCECPVLGVQLCMPWEVSVSIPSALSMAGLIQRTAQAIDDMWQSIDMDRVGRESRRLHRRLITGLAIPVIPIV